MELIDRYAYSNRLRTVDPLHKALIAFAVVLLCLGLDRPAVGLLASLGLWGLASLYAGLPGLMVGRLLLAEAAFLAMTVLGVVVSIALVPIEGADWSLNWGPLWLGVSQPSVEIALRLVTRALGCVAALNFLALTTPLVDLLDLAHRLRVPPLLVDLMTLTYRFIFTLLESLARIRAAQESRLGYAGMRRGMVSAGILAGRLFLDAYHRSRRLQVALEGRGYSGDLRVLPSSYRTDAILALLGAGLIAALLTAWAWI